MSCPSCTYPNDEGAKFCQSCGCFLVLRNAEPVDLSDLICDERIRTLDGLIQNTPYCKKKYPPLKKSFHSFCQNIQRVSFLLHLMILGGFSSLKTRKVKPKYTT